MLHVDTLWQDRDGQFDSSQSTISMTNKAPKSALNNQWHAQDEFPSFIDVGAQAWRVSLCTRDHDPNIAESVDMRHLAKNAMDQMQPLDK